MKLSQMRGKEAIDALADLLDPVTEIVADKEFEKIYKSKPLLFSVKYILKHHQDSILTILAIMNGEDPDYFEPKFWQLPKMIMEVLEDEDVKSLFQSQQMKNLNDNSFAVTQNIKETETI